MACRASINEWFLSGCIAASALVAGFASAHAVAQTPPARMHLAQAGQAVSEPMQLTPRALRSRDPARVPEAPATSSGAVVPPDPQPGAAVDPPPMPHKNLRELAIPGQIMPGSSVRGGRATVYSQGYARRHRTRLTGERMARQIFKPNVLNGKGSGFFMKSPDGVIYLLPVTPEKLQRLSIRAEVRLLAVGIRLRQRRDRILRLRRNYHERMRARNEARLKQSGGKRRLAEFYSDTSLQAEDVVATDKGLFVFRGTQDFPYSRKDFVPLAQWRKAGSTRSRERLNAMQREMRRNR
jgi:hypothetical protein